MNCLVMNASNKHRIDEKKCGVYWRASPNSIFACPCGIYLRMVLIQVMTVFYKYTYMNPHLYYNRTTGNLFPLFCHEQLSKVDQQKIEGPHIMQEPKNTQSNLLWVFDLLMTIIFFF